MEKSLTQEQLDHLQKFIGYGSVDADVWFLGMEEGGGGEENIRARLKFEHIEDCERAHQILGVTKYHSGKRVIQRTWRGMSYLMLVTDDKEPHADNIRNYQAEKLGRFEGNTLLCELMPLPKPKINDWSYNNLIPQYKSRNDYYESVKPMRLELLKEIYRENSPKIIVAYGKQFWPDYKELFNNVEFKEVDQFFVGHENGTKIILTHHFTSKTMNGKLDDLAAIIDSAA